MNKIDTQTEIIITPYVTKKKKQKKLFIRNSNFVSSAEFTCSHTNKNDVLCSHHVHMTPKLHEHLAVQSVATADLGNRSTLFYFFTNE